MTKFRQFEKYPTRNGGTALVLRVNSTYDRITAAAYDRDDQYIGTFAYHADGGVYSLGQSQWDILPPEPEKLVEWRNIYRGSLNGCLLFGAGGYRTREVANRYAETSSDGARNANGDITLTRVGCHRIELRAEFEPDDTACADVEGPGGTNQRSAR